MDWVSSYIRYLGKRAEAAIEREVEGMLPARGEFLVDCGSGDGEKTLVRGRRLAARRVVGLEESKESCLSAERKGVEVYRTDLSRRWPLPSGKVDCVTATEVVEHVVDLDNFFCEAKRVLKPGGTIVISTENLAGYRNIWALLLGRQPYTGPYLSRLFPIGHGSGASYYRGEKGKRIAPHINVMTAWALRELLIIYGFRVDKLVGVAFYPLPGIMASLAAKLDKYHASYCVVKAIK